MLTMAKALVKSALMQFGVEMRRAKLRSFTIEGLRYEADPFSVGYTPQGEQTARAAVRLIRERGLKNIRVMDVCCGVGIIGLTTWASLRDIVTGVGFVDINIFNLNSLRRGLELNALDKDPRFKIWLSDALQYVPDGEKFDLILSNPPHYFTKKFTDGEALSASRLGTYDQDWKLHRDFYQDCHRHLTPDGEVWFLENGIAAEERDLLPFIHANPALEYVRTVPEPTVPKFFWMMSRLKH